MKNCAGAGAFAARERVMQQESGKSKKSSGLQIGPKTLVLTVAVLLVVVIVAGILTLVLPQGSFARTVVDGREVVVPGTYAVENAGRLPVWRWLTAPVEVLFSPEGVTAGMIIVFLLLIGGTFQVLDESHVLNYIILSVIRRFGEKKYRLILLMCFLCMLVGSTIGMFEETVTLVPITVALALSLGWDSLVGLGMSILAVGFGFASATFNPFTVGITQKLAGLPAFSGLALRMGVFVAVYLMLTAFLVRYAKRVEQDPKASLVYEHDLGIRGHYLDSLDEGILQQAGVRRAALVFAGALGLVLVYVVTGFFVSGLSDYSLPVMAVCFTAGGLVAGRLAGLKKGLFGHFIKGLLAISPSVVLILLAMSAKFIMTEGGIMDTILNAAYGAIGGASPYAAVLLLLVLVLFMQFFIGSATAKAFLIMPLILPLVDLVGLTRQTAVQAFLFGDGFTNMIFPTNAVLLISIGLVGIPYGKWFRWTWKLQLGTLLLSVAVLLGCVALGYGPF